MEKKNGKIHWIVPADSNNQPLIDWLAGLGWLKREKRPISKWINIGFIINIIISIRYRCSLMLPQVETDMRPESVKHHSTPNYPKRCIERKISILGLLDKGRWWKKNDRDDAVFDVLLSSILFSLYLPIVLAIFLLLRRRKFTNKHWTTQDFNVFDVNGKNLHKITNHIYNLLLIKQIWLKLTFTLDHIATLFWTCK